MERLIDGEVGGGEFSRREGDGLVGYYRVRDVSGIFKWSVCLRLFGDIVGDLYSGFVGLVNRRLGEVKEEFEDFKVWIIRGIFFGVVKF